jgi:hypothetical protein
VPVSLMHRSQVGADHSSTAVICTHSSCAFP